jgi:hypothetical protein
MSFRPFYDSIKVRLAGAVYKTRLGLYANLGVLAGLLSRSLRLKISATILSSLVRVCQAGGGE